MSYRLSSKLTLALVVALMLGLALVLMACEQDTPAPEPTAVAQQPAATQACPTAAPCPEAEACPEPTACPECPAGEVTGTAGACPFQDEWAASAHADAEAEAFRHWDEEDPKEVPVDCAKCHAGVGFVDFVGGDGTAAGVVDNPAPVDTVIDCQTCHNQAASNWHLVTFPSGISVTVPGPEARCTVCHQGRASTPSLNAAIERAGLTDPDASSADLRFVNIHYYAAAATQYGGVVQGGYQYEGKTYDARFNHVDGFNRCVDCHSPHSLELNVEACAECHDSADSLEALRDIRMAGSTVDYDGDGDLEEGIAREMEGLQGMLLEAIQAYATEVNGVAAAYNPDAYPYFFIDTNENGEADDGEADAYTPWTPRLLKAAYNYQTSIKDPGSFAHGPKYIIQLLYDSIEDLNAAISSPIDLEAANRTDVGHFAGDGEAWRHWDAEGEVPGTCAKCHSGDGLPTFLANAANIAEPPANGMECSTCHDNLTTFTRYQVESVPFPSGATLALDNPDSNLCLECHQGRESTVSVNRAIAGLEPDTPSDRVRFRNVHYFAAGATLFGTEAKGAYEFEGKTYVGRFPHVDAFNTCIECHSTHNLAVQVQACAGCHSGAEELEDIRMDQTDYDGDGAEEGIAGEIETMQEALYAAIQAYAADTAGTALVYNSARYPYFFADANGNGEIDEGEQGYATWTPRLLQSAYNYQYAQKDPGKFAHNAKYILQVLYDSLENVGGDVSGMTRP